MSEYAELPYIQELGVVQQHGAFHCTLARLYTDGIDVSGKAAKVARKVWVFQWCPIGAVRVLKAKMVITTFLHSTRLWRKKLLAD